MSFALDLTVKGKPTPRTTERPGSARKPQRPLSANRAKSVSSNIFGGGTITAGGRGYAAASQTDEAATRSKLAAEGRAKSAPHAKQSHAANSNEAAVISKAQLDAVKSITGHSKDAVSLTYRDQADHSRVHPPPDGVPKLHLGVLEDHEEKLKNPVKSYHPSIETPNSSSSVNWGTPNRPPSGKKPRGGGWQVNSSRPPKAPLTSKPKKHDDVPSLDLCLSKSNEGLKELTKVAKQVHEDLKIEYIGAAQKLVDQKNQEKMKGNTLIAERGEEDNFGKEDDSIAAASLLLSKLGDSKKKDFVEEAVLLDQLSRATVSEESYSGVNAQTKLDPRQQRHRDLYSSHAPITGSTSESSLSKRLRFGARIVTRNGHDAHREINGFFFPYDGTITMYEFRQFGTRSIAMPFIQRNTYSHIRGRKKNMNYTLLDIAVGNELHFTTVDQASLPDSLKSKPTIAFKITEIDEEGREKLIYDGCRTAKERGERAAWVENYESPEDKQHKELLIALRGSLQSKLKKRAIKTVTNLAKHFKKMDKSGDGVLDKSELKAALKDFRLAIPDQHFDYIWNLVDTNEDGKLDYGEFVRGFIGEMNEFRKRLVRKAFARLDTSKAGFTRKDDLIKFFSAKKHPKVLSGEKSEAEITNELVLAFEASEKRGEISYSEFIDFYEGLSIQTETDQEFASIMRSSWGV
eukprot:gene12752-14059_t